MLFGFPIALDLLGEQPFGDFDRAIKYEEAREKPA
jgi:hypothetical protein